MKKRILTLVMVLFFIINGYFYINRKDKEKYLSSLDNEIVFSYEKIDKENDYYKINAETVNGKDFTSCAVNSFIKNRIVEFQKLSNKQVPDLRNNNFKGKYLLDISIENFQTERYISYLIKTGEYTGGANTNQIVNAFTFDKKKKEEIKLSNVVDRDIFMNELKNKLSELEEKGDLFPGTTKEINFEDINSFYITDQNLMVAFSKYQVAPGAAGIIEIKLSKENLIK